MKRVVIIDGKAAFGGGQRMLPLIAHAFINDQPIVIRPHTCAPQSALNHVQVERLHFPAYPVGLRRVGPMLRVLPQVLATAWQLRRCLQKNHIKVIIANDLYSLIPLLPAVAGLKISVFFYAHSCDLPAAATRLLAHCQGVIACSRAAAEALPATPTRNRVVHNAVDIPQGIIKPVSATDHWRFGYAGRIDENKNLSALLQAFAQVRATLDCVGPPALFEILGCGEPGHVDELKIMVEHLGLAAAVRWLPWTEHPLPIMARWNAVVLASHMESFGLCLVEGQMLGKHVMGTRRGGIPEVISDGISGILADSPAIEDLAAALIRLRNAPLEIAEEGQRQAYQRFSPAAYAENLQQAIKDLAEST